MIESLIFSAPTSAGKSFVGDMLMLKHLYETENGLTIFVLPFLSLIAEKEAKIGPLLKDLGFKHMSIHSHKRPIIPDENPP